MLISVLTACTVIVLVQGVELQSIASVFWNSASIAGDGEFLQALLSHGEVRSMANTVCTTIFILRNNRRVQHGRDNRGADCPSH